ncbi:MAG: anthrone oxygenase family protein [Actinomycetota bacterium]|nr:anthrone oxygenase family protein [Actinomycetota bacterium]
MTSTTRILVIVGAAGTGLVAGALFVFSAFVMPALDRIGGRQAITAMQSINRLAVTAPFMIAFLGTALVSVALAVLSVTSFDEPASRYQLLAAVLYLATFVITAAYHVPRNDALGLADPAAADAGAVWSAYSGGWTAMNHVRTATALAASTLLTVSTRIG